MFGLCGGLVACDDNPVEVEEGPPPVVPPQGMVWVPGGTFVMGSDDGEGMPDEKPERQPSVAGFFLDQTEVSNEQFVEGLNQALAGGEITVVSTERSPIGGDEAGHRDPGTYTSPYGAFHMAGNVWEWCHDWYDSSYYGQGPDVDPTGPEVGEERVARGGCWYNMSYFGRCAARNALLPHGSSTGVGFRTVRRP